MTCDISYLPKVSLESLMRHVAPVVPAVPHDYGMELIRQAYIEFCRRTRLVQAQFTYDYQKGVTDYEIVPPDGYEVFFIEEINSPSWKAMDRWDIYNSKSKFEVIDNAGIRLNSVPSVDVEEGLKIRAVLLPNNTCSYIYSSIDTPYGKGIAAKAVADLVGMPDKPWHQPGSVPKYEREFGRAVASGKALASSGRKAGPIEFRRVRVV